MIHAITLIRIWLINRASTMFISTVLKQRTNLETICLLAISNSFEVSMSMDDPELLELAGAQQH
jgi:hypothetical protein